MENALKHWILEKGKLKEVDLMTWAKWFENKNSDGRITKQTIIPELGISISTAFLGIDHSFGGDVPILWETMIFGSKHEALDGYQVRYSSLKAAKKGHHEAVKFAKNILSPVPINLK